MSDIPDEFDLDNPPPVLDDETPAQRRRRERRDKIAGGTGSETKARPSKAKAAQADGDLKSRLEDGFQKLADQMRARDDDELADALQDGKGPMAASLVSMTKVVKWFRKPLVLFVGILEPILAFWRVGGILLGRMFIWRENMTQQVPSEQVPADQWRQDQAVG